ncbi:MAG TPA: PepSY domain-containing protein [Burkholderiales bacterium]|nr:PepSY domain-containing protein [Burkholderiales bacterium]
MTRNAIHSLLATAAISTSIFMLSTPVFADDDMVEMRAIAKAANLIVPEKAIEKALAVKPGTVVDADIDRKFKGYYYEIEIIDAQAVEWEVDIDAKTGEVRRVKRDWFD